MLLLALCPILSMYTHTYLNYAIWAFLLLIAWIIITNKAVIKNQTIFPLYYGLYWVYCAFDYFIISPKLGALVPGGINFFVFSVILIFISKQFDIEIFKKIFRVLVLITVGLFFGQEFMWYTTGTRFVPFLPLGNLTTTLTYEQLVFRNMYTDRSASIFLEPAHFATFLLLGLLIELFSHTGKQPLSNYAIIIIFALLLLRSGTGLAGLVVLLLYKLPSYLRRLSGTRKVFMTIIVIALLSGGLYVYFGTEVGSEMLGRSQNELTLDVEGHSYGRFMHGIIIFEKIPFINKIIGASDDALLPITKSVSFWNTDERANLLYMNGWSYALTHTGLIGFGLLLLVIVKLYRNNQDMAKCGIWLFVVLSLFGQTYTQPVMLIVFVIATYYQHQRYSNQEIVQ